MKSNKENYSLDWKRLKGNFQNTYGIPGKSAISYYHIKDFEYFKSAFNTLAFDIEPDTVWYMEVEFYEPGYLNPHVDHGPICCINYHIESCEAKTDFYSINGKTKNKAVFTHDELTLEDSFIAKDNEAWLLDISKPHSVYSSKTGIRKSITWQWLNHSFREIVLTDFK